MLLFLSIISKTIKNNVWDEDYQNELFIHMLFSTSKVIC